MSYSSLFAYSSQPATSMGAVMANPHNLEDTEPLSTFPKLSREHGSDAHFLAFKDNTQTPPAPSPTSAHAASAWTCDGYDDLVGLVVPGYTTPLHPPETTSFPVPMPTGLPDTSSVSSSVVYRSASSALPAPYAFGPWETPSCASAAFNTLRAPPALNRPLHHLPPPSGTSLPTPMSHEKLSH